MTRAETQEFPQKDEALRHRGGSGTIVIGVGTKLQKRLHLGPRRVLSSTKMRTLVTLLSILLLWVFGALGEELLNWLHVYCEQCGGSLPFPTAFFYQNYGLNSGIFALSLTPFALMFLGVLLVSLAKGGGPDRFLYAFVAVWLLAGLYLAVFCYSVLLPFIILLKKVGDPSASRVILAVDAVLLAVVVGLCAHRLWKRRKSAQAAAPDVPKLK